MNIHSQVNSHEGNVTVVGKNILSDAVRLLVPSCITSNRKLKPEATGHRTRLYL